MSGVSTMRLTRAIKLVTMAGMLSTLVTLCLWSSCAKQTNEGGVKGETGFINTRFNRRGTNSIGDLPGDHDGQAHYDNDDVQHMAMDGQGEGRCHPVACDINNENTIGCLKEGDQVFMPFDFIKEYFEVFGTMTKTKGEETLNFHHANAIVHPPRATYRPDSIFMAFDHYNVENRERVKCVTASEGVPITTQWSKEGYHYPIQIAQYGLSHHGKNIIQGAPDRLVLEDAEEDNIGDWTLPDKKSTLRLQQFTPGDNRVLEFGTSDSLFTKGISLSAEEKISKCFSMDVKFVTNGSVTVVVTISGGETMKIHYLFSSLYVGFDGKSNIFYGLGERRVEWIHLARDLKVDLLKGLLVKLKMDRIKTGFSLTKIVEFRLNGRGMMDNLTLSRTIHMDQFYSAANWLAKHQDDRGGWPVMVQRVVTGFPELAPGWYSAMGQGQAMSVLVRAYLDSKSDLYLDAAVKAMQLFQVDSVDGGVRARFFDKYDWYEEYPTTPSSFVLNGFVYSLLGLYDLKETASGQEQVLAERIYNSGMTSLKSMIGMYDTGVGTLYDLRHITIGSQPNRARWDYHTTHINQMLQLMIIDDDEIFQTTVQRWLGYLKGKRSRHN